MTVVRSPNSVCTEALVLAASVEISPKSVGRSSPPSPFGKPAYMVTLLAAPPFIAASTSPNMVVVPVPASMTVVKSPNNVWAVLALFPDRAVISPNSVCNRVTLPLAPPFIVVSTSPNMVVAPVPAFNTDSRSPNRVCGLVPVIVPSVLISPKRVCRSGPLTPTGRPAYMVAVPALPPVTVVSTSP